MKKRSERAASAPVAHAENPRNRVGASRAASQSQIAPGKPNRPRNVNARLLATIEASVDCVITIDAHSTILEFSAAAERTFGYAREKVIGKPLAEMIIPPSLREAHQRGMAAVLKGGTRKLLGKRVEMPAMRSDGSEFPVELTVTQIAGQTPPIFTAYLRDITDRKQAEEALKAQALRYKTLMETSTDSIYVVRENGDLQEANAAFLRRRGYTAEEVKGLNVADWDARWTHEQLQARLRNLVGSDAVFETRHRCKDGSIFDAEISVTSVRIGGEPFFFCVTRDITERKQAEKAIQESERKYRELVELIHDLVWAVDAEGRITYMSPASRHIYGREPEEMIGHLFTDYMAPDEARRSMADLAKMIATGDSVIEVESRLLHRDGHEIVLSANGVVLRDGAGNIVGTTGTSRDVTERKLAEEALRESEERFRELAENINEVFWVWTAPPGNARCLYVSPAYAAIWGRSCESLYSSPQSWMEALHPQDQERVREEGARMDFEKISDWTYRIVRPDQSIRWIRDRIFPVRDRSGVVVRCAGIAEDITESKTIAEALESAEEQYRSIFDNAVNGIFRTSPDGKLLVTNPAAARIFGFDSPEESIEARSDIAHQGYVDPHRRDELIRLLEEHGAVKGFEFEAYRKDGSRVWISENTRAVHSPSGEILYFEGIFEDVTERKRAEEALRESEERFRTIFEQAPLGISEGEIATARFINANHRYVDILGYTTDELRALTFTDYTHPEDLQKDLIEFQKLAAGKIRTYAMEKRYLRKDGDIIWVNLTVAGLAQPGQKPLNCLAVVEDITERKQAEDLLRWSEEKFKALFALAPVGIAFLDSRLNIVGCNPALERMTRLSREELWGGAWQRRTFLNADGSPRPPGERVTERAVSEKRLVNGVETGAVMEEGDIVWAEVSVAPLALPDASAVVIMQDITARKRAAKQLEEANRQLRVLSRQLFHIQEEERRHLARELHDEIGQTLTAVKINLKIIAPDVPAKATGRLDDSVQLLDRLLGQVRQLSLDLRPPLLDELGLVPTLRWLVDQQAQRAGLRVIFTTNVYGLEMDPDVRTACFRVAQEGITNIIRHSGAKSIAVELRRETGRLWLSVRDDGAGFDPSAIEDGAAQHSSLGLVSMKERALLVRGGLEVQSAPGQGTEIRAWFPLAPGEPPTPEAA